MLNYSILISLGESTIWQERKGTKIKDDSFILFGEKRRGKYIITEACSGTEFAQGRNKKEAIENYKSLLESLTVETIKEKLAEMIKKYGESPMFKKF